MLNANQKKLLLVSLAMFWVTILYLPSCNSIRGGACNALDEYAFVWDYIDGIYIPLLMVEWVAIAVNFIALYFYFDEQNS